MKSFFCSFVMHPHTAMAAQSVEGMTVNERLYHFGLLERFSTAAQTRDVSAMVQVLLQAGLSEAQATETSQAVAADPKRYGC